MRIITLLAALIAIFPACGAAPREVAPAVQASGDAVHPVFDEEALAHLRARAVEEHTTSLLVSIDGEVVAVDGEDAPLGAMSVSKSITSLAVGLLVDDGVIALDDPVVRWFPEWAGTPYEAITVRHLLSHTSGLTSKRADMQPSDGDSDTLPGDIERHALGSALEAEPGTRFIYSNNAVDFLAVLVQRACGKTMDVLLQQRLFDPLGVHDAVWVKDSKGVPFAAGELQIRPSGLLAIGQLLLDGGVIDGRRVVTEAWIAASMQPSQPFHPSNGLLWYLAGDFGLAITGSLHGRWRAEGAPEALLAATEPLVGEAYPVYPAYEAGLKAALGDDGFAELRAWWGAHREVPYAEQVLVGEVKGFYAQGWLGQYLVVIPKHRIVAVRMRRFMQEDADSDVDRFSYPEFPRDVTALVP